MAPADSNLTTMSLHGHEFLIQAGATIYDETYESHVFDRLMPLMHAGITFLDVGANIGMFAVHAALRGAEVIAVEARASNSLVLLENARRAQVSVELHPLAVSDHHGYAMIRLAKNENAIIRCREVNLNESIVPLGLLDELVGDRRIDVVKIDIEGHEYRALMGATGMLRRCRPWIVTEYDPKFQMDSSGVPGSTYLRFLQEFGYRFYVLHRLGKEIHEVSSLPEIDAICLEWGHHADLLLEPMGHL